MGASTCAGHPLPLFVVYPYHVCVDMLGFAMRFSVCDKSFIHLRSLNVSNNVSPIVEYKNERYAHRCISYYILLCVCEFLFKRAEEEGISATHVEILFVFSHCLEWCDSSCALGKPFFGSRQPTRSFRGGAKIVCFFLKCDF